MKVEIFVGSVDEHKGILPALGTQDSAGVDLSTPYDFVLKPGEQHLVNTALVIKIPRTFCILILPRSGLACKHGIEIPNSPGLIDRDYCGSDDFIKVMLKNNGSESFTFSRGDRIAQGLFVRYETPEWTIWEGDESFKGFGVNRGGFGSTGLG